MNNDRFDNHFDRIMKHNERIARGITWAFPAVILAGIATGVGVVYVAIHFLSKLW